MKIQRVTGTYQIGQARFGNYYYNRNMKKYSNKQSTSYSTVFFSPLSFHSYSLLLSFSSYPSFQLPPVIIVAC